MKHIKKKNNAQSFFCALILLCIIFFVVNSEKIRPSAMANRNFSLSYIMDIVCPKMDVQAANSGYTAKDLSGTAYSVFSESKSTLYITRSENASLQIGDTYPEFTDDYGAKITDGIVAQTNIENSNPSSDNSGKPGWIVHNSEEVATKVIAVAFIKDIKPINTTAWFKDFTALSKITGMENHLDTSKVTNMNKMFTNCPKLISLDVSELITGNVINMAGMFRGCSGLSSLNLSGFNTGKVTDMSGMFYNCSNLTSIDVSNKKK